MFFLTLTQQDAHKKRITRIYCGGKQKRQRSDKMDQVYFQLRTSRSKSIKEPQVDKKKQNQIIYTNHESEINNSVISTVLNSSQCNIVSKNNNLVINKKPNKFYYNKNDSFKLLRDHPLFIDKGQDKLRGILLQEKCKIYNNPYGLCEKQHTLLKDSSMQESQRSHIQLPQIQQLIEGQLTPRTIQKNSFKKSTQELFYQKFD